MDIYTCMRDRLMDIYLPVCEIDSSDSLSEQLLVLLNRDRDEEIFLPANAPICRPRLLSLSSGDLGDFELLRLV